MHIYGSGLYCLSVKLGLDCTASCLILLSQAQLYSIKGHELRSVVLLTGGPFSAAMTKDSKQMKGTSSIARRFRFKSQRVHTAMISDYKPPIGRQHMLTGKFLCPGLSNCGSSQNVSIMSHHSYIMMGQKWMKEIET